ncbi:hypothetical protein LQ567_24640 [Niabella pedocola]|uniref:Uncharacterized protein n=1 Tax=Niabella pedocola TaxID=1752077 RepID=A0ABS8PYP4_9BACT|nr:hypothetical protein [Niabella pedocola]MCD2425995.1 hypothetical protein [Niabella pedocola]
MKTRFLILTATLFSLILLNQQSAVAAPCTFVSPLIQVQGTSNVIINGQPYCRTTLTLSVDIDVNGGNKYTYIHVWTAGGYHNGQSWTYSNQAPTSANILGNALFTLALDYSQQPPNPVLSATYGPDNTVNVLDASDGVTFTKTPVPNSTATHFVFQNIVIDLPGACNSSAPPLFKGDSWSAQDNNGKIVACALPGFVFSAADPSVVALIGCGNPGPNILNFTVTANGTGNSIQFAFDVYQETDGIAGYSVTDTKIYDGGATLYTVVQGASNSSLTFSSASGTNDATHIYLPAIYPAPYSTNNPDRIKNLYVVVRSIQITNGGTTTNVDFGLVTPAVNTCSPLSAAIEGITVSRANDRLVVNWRTLSEKNSKEFVVEASNDGKNWTAIGKLDSKGVDGNSDLPIDYSLALIIPASLAAIGLGGLFLLTLVRSRWAKVLAIAVIVVAAASCLKDGQTVDVNRNQTVFVRIAQYDKSGTVQYSKVVTVVND